MDLVRCWCPCHRMCREGRPRRTRIDHRGTHWRHTGVESHALACAPLFGAARPRKTSDSHGCEGCPESPRVDEAEVNVEAQNEE